MTTLYGSHYFVNNTEARKVFTICSMVFPQFLQAGTQVLARNKDNFLDNNTPPGAAPAFMGKTKVGGTKHADT